MSSGDEKRILHIPGDDPSEEAWRHTLCMATPSIRPNNYTLEMYFDEVARCTSKTDIQAIRFRLLSRSSQTRTPECLSYWIGRGNAAIYSEMVGRYKKAIKGDNRNKKELWESDIELEVDPEHKLGGFWARMGFWFFLSSFTLQRWHYAYNIVFDLHLQTVDENELDSARAHSCIRIILLRREQLHVQSVSIH